MPSGKGNYSFWASRSTHYYDIVTLGYYNGPNKTNPISKANEKQFIITLREYIIHKKSQPISWPFLFYRNIDVISRNVVSFSF